MKKVSYMTLSAVRDQDPERFDRAIKEAVLAAGMKVGAAVVFGGLCHQQPTNFSAGNVKQAA